MSAIVEKNTQEPPADFFGLDPFALHERAKKVVDRYKRLSAKKGRPVECQKRSAALQATTVVHMTARAAHMMHGPDSPIAADYADLNAQTRCGAKRPTRTLYASAAASHGFADCDRA